MLVDTFGVGLLLGILFGAGVFASARVALGLLGSVAAGLIPYVVANGVDALQHALDGFITSLGSDPHLAVGSLFGVIITGALSVIFRSFSNWI